MAKLERLIITCGGTGGHFYPGLSIARTFAARGGKVKLLLSGINSALQATIATKFGIEAVELRRMPSLKHPIDFAIGLVSGFSSSRRELRAFQAQALVGMGSFASLPAVAAAKFCGIPVFLHDGNARIGKANRWLSRVARCLGAGYPPVNADKCHCEIVDCGMPVRPELAALSEISRADAIAALNSKFGVALNPELPIILIFGGSQGAAVFNEVLPQALRALDNADFQVLHLCGKGKKEVPEKIYNDAKFTTLLLESSEDMAYFLGAANLIFSRSGGSSLAEIALFGKTAVLIPYPYAAEGHQTDNARYLVDSDGAVMVENSQFNVAKATELIQDFLINPDKWSERAVVAKKLAKPHAAEDFLAAVEKAL